MPVFSRQFRSPDYYPGIKRHKSATLSTILPIILLFVIGFTNVTASPYETGGKTYKFGVFPYLSAVRLESIYAPISVELSQALKVQVNFRTATDFKIFFTKLKNQDYDFALIQPFWYPPAVDKFGYLPLVRVEDPFVSLIMVLENSPIRAVNDLKGKVIATPPEFVPVVHMAKRALRRANLIPGKDVTLKAFKTVDSCFQQIIIGAASACVAPPFAPALIEEKMNIRLRVVVKTRSIPNLSLVVHSRVSAQQRNKIEQAFLTISESEAGTRLLKTLRSRRFIRAQDREYNVVREYIREINKR